MTKFTEEFARKLYDMRARGMSYRDISISAGCATSSIPNTFIKYGMKDPMPKPSCARRNSGALFESAEASRLHLEKMHKERMRPVNRILSECGLRHV